MIKSIVYVNTFHGYAREHSINQQICQIKIFEIDASVKKFKNFNSRKSMLLNLKEVCIYMFIK
jgi:hypothetical protein